MLDDVTHLNEGKCGWNFVLLWPENKVVFFVFSPELWLNSNRFAYKTLLVLSKAINAVALPEYAKPETHSGYYVLFKLCLTDVFLLGCKPVVDAWLACCCAAGIISLQMSAALSKADLTVSHIGFDAAASLQLHWCIVSSADTLVQRVWSRESASILS